MARTNSAPEAETDTPNSEDWQALRGELVALLDQVEQQVGTAAPEGAGISGLSERMRDLREQVAAAAPANRRREALRTVQKAVERMTDREEPVVAEPNPRQALQSAIDEIRARQANKSSPKPVPSTAQSEAAARLAQAERDAAAAREELAKEQAAARAAAEAEAARAAAEAAAREAAERQAREEADRRARAESERQAREAAEAIARAEEAARQEASRLEAARQEAARVEAARQEAARQEVARRAAAEQAAREQAVREQAAKEQAARDQAAKEQAAREKATREAAERDAAMRAQAARETAEREAAAREAERREAAAREAAARERENALREAAAREQAAREAEKRAEQVRLQAAQEQAAREDAARRLVRQELARIEVPKLPDFSPRFDELAGAVGTLSGRLERLEGELKTQAGNGTVQEVAEQVAQLSHVVEALAAAVGETGQVKRLETQIAGLAKMLVNNQKGDHVDMVALTQRLDEVSGTVERLADLQMQHVSRERELPAQQAALRAGIQVIEKSVRNVYDRIDVIEKNYALTPADFERLQSEMATFADAVREAGDKPQQLAAVVEALHDRIATIEGRSGDVQELRNDIMVLRDAVLGSVEPRFAAVETQLEALNERIAARPQDIPGVTLIEAQVRQLVARMDQTGAQLSTLAKLYAESEERDADIDYDALAELVLSRTEDALARLEPPAPIDVEALATMVANRTQEKLAEIAPVAPAPLAPVSTGLSDEDIAALEARMSRVFHAAAAERRQPEDLSDMQEGIRKVDDRIGRLEDMINRLNSEQRVLSREASAAPADILRRDTMPVAPTLDRPLGEQTYVDPVRAALEARNGGRKRHPGLEADDPPSFSELSPISAAMVGGKSVDDLNPSFDQPPSFDPAPVFDPDLVERPPRPESAFDAPMRDVFSSGTVPDPVPPPAPPPSNSSRNTFMEAQRRAMQRHAQATTPAVGGSSLLSRALSRFQSTPAPEEKKTAAKAPAPEEQKSKEKAKKPEPAIPEAVGLPPVESVTEPVAPEAVTDEAPRSFLVRHRQPILLALSVVALSFLTLNLISQRMSSEQDAVTDPATIDAAAPAADAPAMEASTPDSVSELVTPVVPDALESVPDDATPVTDTAETTAPRVIPMSSDALATGSVNPTATSFAQSEPQAMPDAFAATSTDADATAAIDTAALAPVPATPADTLPVTAPVTEEAAVTPNAAVPAELPPDSIGPVELRQAAAAGDARAQFEVAAIYTEGRAVAQDLAAAATWYERAAAQGFAPAEYRLGNLYENGRGVTKDLEQARLWYQRAAEAGNRMSMHNLAALYAGGELGKQDFESAAKWFEEAADQGLTDSQFNLGMLYARGLGVPQDLEASYKWFALASMSGDVDAAKSRDDIAKSLTPDAVSKVAADVAAWKANPINLAANFAPIGTWSATFDPGPAIDKREVVVGVQTLLNRLGFDVGTADGFAGPRTAEAIKSFERATGMTEVGQINPRLLAVLSSQPV